MLIMPLVAVVLALGQLSVSLAAVAERPPGEPLLRVTAQPGYTTWLSAFQVAGYPLLVLHADGTLLVGEHRQVTGAVEFTLQRGQLSATEVAAVVAALPGLLPAEPEPGGAVIIDAGSVRIEAEVSGERERRELMWLEPTLAELLELPTASADRRDALQRRLRFAQLLAALREYASEPYVPALARAAAEPYEAVAGGRTPAVCEWPVGRLPLDDLVRATERTTDRGKLPLDVRDPATLAALATTVVSNRIYRAGERLYVVAWVPVLEP